LPGILIVDDHPLVRRSVRTLLTTHSMNVCGEAEDGKAAIEKAIELRPDIIVLDITMPIMNGFEAAQEIRRILPLVKIVFLTLHDSAAFKEKCMAWSDAYVHKFSASTELVPALMALLEPQQVGFRYAWQQAVADAISSPSKALPHNINAAERMIAARLTDSNEADRAERKALKQALRVLEQLISETTPVENQHEKFGLA